MKILSDFILTLLIVDIILTRSESRRHQYNQTYLIVPEKTSHDSRHLLKSNEAHPDNGTICCNYHECIGIPEAERILIYETDSRRVTGGRPSHLGGQPYQGGLIIHLTDDDNVSTCGCSLLSHVRVLTAAHCWRHGAYQAHSFTVVLGSTTLYSGGVRVETTGVTTHEKYDHETMSNDIAVIKIPSVGFNEFIEPIALPSGKELDNDWTNYEAIISGFGYTEKHTTVDLQHARIGIISNEECQKRIGTIAKIKDSNVCTSGRDGVGPCSGDSGGPLAVSTGKMVLVGVASFVAKRKHSDDCVPEYPAAYTRVSAYIDWIQTFMSAM